MKTKKPTGIEALVCGDIADRQTRGVKKYGTTVAENPLGLREWLQHAYEECLDQAIYLRRAIEEMDKKTTGPADPPKASQALREFRFADKASADNCALVLGEMKRPPQAMKMVLITGPAGSGKTTLAQKMALVCGVPRAPLLCWHSPRRADLEKALPGFIDHGFVILEGLGSLRPGPSDLLGDFLSSPTWSGRKFGTQQIETKENRGWLVVTTTARLALSPDLQRRVISINLKGRA